MIMSLLSANQRVTFGNGYDLQQHYKAQTTAQSGQHHAYHATSSSSDYASSLMQSQPRAVAAYTKQAVQLLYNVSMRTHTYTSSCISIPAELLLVATEHSRRVNQCDVLQEGRGRDSGCQPLQKACAKLLQPSVGQVIDERERVALH
jgi:hypothetical protein